MYGTTCAYSPIAAWILNLTARGAGGRRNSRSASSRLWHGCFLSSCSDIRSPSLLLPGRGPRSAGVADRRLHPDLVWIAVCAFVVLDLVLLRWERNRRRRR